MDQIERKKYRTNETKEFDKVVAKLLRKNKVRTLKKRKRIKKSY